MQNSRRQILWAAIGLESALFVFALLMGRALDVPLFTDDPAASFEDGLIFIGASLLGVAPLWLLLLFFERSTWDSLASLRTIVLHDLMPWFRDSTSLDCLWISLSAGIGEETLFRGVIQGGISHGGGTPMALLLGWLLASLLFGLAHWVNRTYAVLATLIGMYLGLWYVATDSLWVPIAIHAIYDYIALRRLQRLAQTVRGDEKPTDKKSGLIKD